MKGDFTHMTGDFLGKKPQEYEINWREISEAEDRYHKELAEWHSKLRVAKKEKLTLLSIYPKDDEHEQGRSDM
jgi:hypothetical protein